MKQLNIKSKDSRAYNLAANLADQMDTSINQAVTLALAATAARLQEHLERGGDPARFVAELVIEGRDQPQQRRDDGAEEVS